MFEVRGMPIFASELEVLSKLREDVLLQQGKSIFYKMKETKDNIMVCCPIHNEGQERRPSCGISTVRLGDKAPGWVNCFACHYSAPLEKMISDVFGVNDNGAFGNDWLFKNFIGGDTIIRPMPILNFTRGKGNANQKIDYVSEEELASYRFTHPYMFLRKLTMEIIERYDVGYQKSYKHGEGWYPTEVVTFPVRDEFGRCLFVSRRAIHNKTFFLPTDIEKPIYGLYELPKNINELVVCESVFNALTSTAYGRPAVALFGTGTDTQYQKLKSLPYRKIVLALDPDSAGYKGTQKIKHALRGRKIVTKLVVPEGKDINDLSREEFWSLPEIFI